MSEASVTGFPKKAFVIGLVLALIGTILFTIHTRTNLTYNIPWAGLAGPDLLVFAGYGFMILIVLIPLLSFFGIRMTPKEYAIIYIMSMVGWTAAAVFWVWGVQIWSVWTWGGGQAVTELGLTGLIPQYWYVMDQRFSEWFFSGGLVPWGAIAGPILFWGLMAACEGLAAFFLAMVFRKQWTEVEGLPFPLASPAVELANMAEEKTGSEKFVRIFKERWLWIAFLVAVILWGFNIIHAFVPTIPRLPIDEIDLNPWGGGNTAVNIDLTSSLKGAMVVLNFNPLWIAAFFFLPLDVLLTTWLAMVAFQWILPAVGISLGVFPDISAQGAWSVWWALGNEWPGAIWYLLGYGFIQGLALWVLFSNRKYIGGAISSAMKGDSESRIGLFGFVGITLLWLIVMFAQGASLVVITIATVYFLLVHLGMMRYRAESTNAGGGFWWWNWTNGVFYTFGNWPLRAPQAYVTLNLASPMGAGPGNTQFAAFSADAMSIATYFKIKAKDLATIVVVTTVVGIVFGGFFYAWWGYAGLRGPGWLNDQQVFAVDLAYNPYTGGVSEKLTALEPTYIPYALGVVLAMVLMWAKAAFATIPLNPVGLIMGCMYMWPWAFTSVFLAWLAKYLIMRTGGTPLYNRLLPASIGFVGGYWFIKVVMWFIVRLLIGVEIPV